MNIVHLKIKNFRGIKNLSWTLPERGIFCLIGKGDSTKSTILDAIKYVFYPNWNLLFDDADFYNTTISEDISIEATIINLHSDFLNLAKYGGSLRGWDAKRKIVEDEPTDENVPALTVRLKVSKDMEPKWHVINDRDSEGIDFKTIDRQKVNVGFIGAYSERQLSWATGTALSKITKENDLSASLAEAARKARASLDTNREVALTAFDEAAKKSENIAKSLGVPIINSYKSQLDINSINIKMGGLSLHDGDIPLRQLGLGSRRMLLCGIQQASLVDKHITLFDEIEFGLEPHRIARLLKYIRDDKSGQYFATTHSPIVLRELTIEDLYIIKNNMGDTSVTEISNPDLREHNLQGRIRTCSEAFLAKKIIICEGATEVGFLRGFDDYLSMTKGFNFSFHGTALVDVNGASKIKPMAKAFVALKYPVAVLADGDAPKLFSPADEAELKGIGAAVHMWTGELSLEERAMYDLPWEQVLKSLHLARDEFECKVRENVCSAIGKSISENFSEWIDSQEMRRAIGSASKKSEWFKSISKGARWFDEISGAFENPAFRTTDLATKITAIGQWVEHD